MHQIVQFIKVKMRPLRNDVVRNNWTSWFNLFFCPTYFDHRLFVSFNEMPSIENSNGNIESCKKNKFPFLVLSLLSKRSEAGGELRYWEWWEQLDVSQAKRNVWGLFSGTNNKYSQYFFQSVVVSVYIIVMCKSLINLLHQRKPRPREKTSTYLPPLWTPWFQRRAAFPNFVSTMLSFISFTCIYCR